MTLTPEARIARLENVVEKLCEALKYMEANTHKCHPSKTQFEILRQAVSGQSDRAY